MDAHRFSADHAERDGAAERGSIFVECCFVATRNDVGTDGSTGCIAAR
jgi:hypothetical protein